MDLLALKILAHQETKVLMKMDALTLQMTQIATMTMNAPTMSALLMLKMLLKMVVCLKAMIQFVKMNMHAPSTSVDLKDVINDLTTQYAMMELLALKMFAHQMMKMLTKMDAFTL